jgi:hypothetical protein
MISHKCPDMTINSRIVFVVFSKIALMYKETARFQIRWISTNILGQE